MLAQWVPYNFYKEEFKGPIEDIEGQKVTCCCEAHDTVLIGTDKGNVLQLDGPGLSPNGYSVQDGSVIQELISPPYTQELLIVIKNDCGVSAHIKANYLYPDGEESDYFELPSNIQFISCSAKLSRIIYTTDLHTFYLVVRNVIPRPEPRAITPNCDSEITGLYITNDEFMFKHIYVTFAKDQILCYHLNNRGAIEEKVLEHYGCSRGCSCLANNGRLVVYHSNKITIFNREAKLSDYVLNTPPRLLSWGHNCLISAAAGTGNTQIKVYDLNTHCSYSTIPHADKVISMLSAFGSLVFIFNDGTWLSQAERDTDYKVNTLCSQEQYAIALQIADSAHMSPAWIADIHRRIGDSRYIHGSYSEAVDQFIEAIGYLEPSYVIKKFLEPQHAEYLCTYLEALHQKRQATTLHSTLLFNCYSKLHRIEAINTMIKQALDDDKLGRPPFFDVDGAADVLLDAGLTDSALLLTRNFHLYRKTVKVLFSAKRYDEAIVVLSDVPASDAEHCIVKYGQDFLDHTNERQKNEFTNLCVQICTKGLRVCDPEGNDDIQIRPCDAELILPIFAQHQKYCFMFLQAMIKQGAKQMTEKLWNNAIQSAIVCGIDELPNIMKHPNANYSREQVIISLQEQYFELAGYKTKHDKDPSFQLPPNCEHDIGRLKEALEILYSKRGNFVEILDQASPSEVIGVCQRYADREPSLIGSAIVKLVKAKEFTLLKQMVKDVQEKNIMDFLEVADLMRKNSVPYEVIADFAMKSVEIQEARIKKHEEELRILDDELDKKEKMIKSLSEEPMLIKPNTFCNTCNMRMEQPCTFFFCGHAFHARCLGDRADVCPICAKNFQEKTQKKLDENEKARQIDSLLEKFQNSTGQDEMSILESVLEGQIFSPDLDDDSIVRFNLDKVTE